LDLNWLRRDVGTLRKDDVGVGLLSIGEDNMIPSKNIFAHDTKDIGYLTTQTLANL